MSYKVLYQAGEDEIEEKKSRFIAHTLPVNSEDEAVAFLNKIKKEYWDARHNCYAYTIGRNNECTRCSDDGEPSGTAGRPILDVLLREEIHNCIVVVTRYFGGTLLAPGGSSVHIRLPHRPARCQLHHRKTVWEKAAPYHRLYRHRKIAISDRPKPGFHAGHPLY